MNTSSSVQQAVAEVSARLDRIPSFPRQMKFSVAVLGGLFAFDLIDLQTFSLVAPAVQRTWGLSPEQLGVLTSMVFVGGLVGAFLGGQLMDRIGRRPVILASVAIFSLASLGSAFAPSPEVLGALRFVTGLGISAASAAILVIVAESFPKSLRGRAMSVLVFASVIGLPLLTVVASLVVPSGNWHYVFLFASLGLFVVIPALWLLPESPRWLASRGRVDEARAWLMRLEDDYHRTHVTRLPAPEIVLEAPAPERRSFLEIFRSGFLKSTLLASVLWGALVVLNTGLNNWFPVIMDMRGYPLDQAYTIFVFVSLGAIIGPFLAAAFVDRIERKWLVVGSAALLIVSYLFVGFLDAVPVIVVGGLVATVFGTVLSTVLFTYIPEIFALEIRGAGVGFAQGFSRVSSVLSAIFIGFLLAQWTPEFVFIYLVIVAALVLVLALFGPTIGIREAHRARVAAKAESKSSRLTSQTT